MKTFIVILYLGKSVGVVGPFGSSLDMCRDSLQDRQWLEPFMVAQSVPYALGDVTLDCVLDVGTPKVGEER